MKPFGKVTAISGSEFLRGEEMRKVRRTTLEASILGDLHVCRSVR